MLMRKKGKMRLVCYNKIHIFNSLCHFLLDIALAKRYAERCAGKMNPKYILKRAFFEPCYEAAYRYLTTEEGEPDAAAHSYRLIQAKGMYWCADPFPFEHNGKQYIFVEYYSLWKRRGEIAYYCLGEAQRPHVVLSEPFHLSYPNVFVWGEEIYMIPESSEAGQLRLYRSESFPNGWVLDKVLLDEVHFVDSSFHVDEAKGLMYIETMDVRKQGMSNRFFHLDMDTKSLTEFEGKGCHHVDMRPAGNFFRSGAHIYHALQDCTRVYGEYMHLCRVAHFDERGLEEQEIKNIKASMFTFENSGNKHVYTHTLNRSEHLEVIDVVRWRFVPLLFLTQCWQRIRHMLSS